MKLGLSHSEEETDCRCEVFGLPGCYAASLNRRLPTFRDSVVAPSSSVKMSKTKNSSSSARRILRTADGKLIVIDEVERMWNEAHVSCFKVLFRYLISDTEKDQEQVI